MKAIPYLSASVLALHAACLTPEDLSPSPDAGADADAGVNADAGPQCPPCGASTLCSGERGVCESEADTWLPLRDGVRLRTRVVLPEGVEGPFPVVLLRTAYWQLAGEVAIDAFRPLVADGYAFVYQSVRGTGESEGELTPLRQEFDDGADTVQWLIEQPWCDGKVGALGGSYEGFTALAAAAASPHLAVALPDGFLSHAFATWPITHNGVPSWMLLWWMHLVETNEDLFTDLAFNSTATNHRPYAELDMALFGEESALWRALVEEMDQDGPTWQAWSMDGRLADLCTPVLLLEAATEWEDDVLDAFLEIGAGCGADDQAAQRFVLGAHAHTGAIYNPLSADPAGELIRGYLETYLKGTTGALDGQPRVHYYVQGAHRWGTAPSWPVATDELRLFLHPDQPAQFLGSLDPEAAPDAEAFSYRFAPGVDDACSPPYTEQLVYLSAALEADLDLVGQVEAVLHLRVDVPDTDIFVYLYEVEDDLNTWNFVSLQAQRLRFRNGVAAPEMVVPGEPLEIALEMVAAGYRFSQGAQVGLVVTSSECGSQENPNTGGPMYTETETRPALIEILSGADHPSQLRIPVVAAP